MDITVFYSPLMSADADSYSPSAGKPAAAVADWIDRKLPINIVEPTPATVDELGDAHDRRYVEQVLSGKTENGFGNRSPEVAASLPYTSGAMLCAAVHAIENRTVACAPVSGFHHAGFQHGGGFCTFNGLMVTLYALRDRGLIKNAAILDLDQHYGNGTDEIIRLLGSTRWVEHYSQNRWPEEAEQFLEDLPVVMYKMMVEHKRADVLLYQAGADSHVDDPLGGYLTTEQMRRRDRIVFEFCAKHDIPVAWNLAGGYQRDSEGSIAPVLALHRATMEECAAVFSDRLAG
jgi:acetoin utilization deacetylase AcuC-like enzyme